MSLNIPSLVSDDDGDSSMCSASDVGCPIDVEWFVNHCSDPLRGVCPAISSIPICQYDESARSAIKEAFTVFNEVPQRVSRPDGKAVADGAGRCSRLFHISDSDGIDKWGDRLFSSLAQVASEGGLQEEAAKGPDGLSAATAKLVDKAVAACVSVCDDALGYVPNTCIEEGQPFRLDLLEAVAKMLGDPDLPIIQWAKEGVDIASEAAVTPCGLWPLREDAGVQASTAVDHSYELWDGNYKSMEELEDRADVELQKDLDEGWTVELQEDEHDKIVAQGILGAVDEGLRANGEPKTRVVWDGTVVGPNKGIVLTEKQEMPGIQEMMAILEFLGDEADDWICIKLDYKAAFKRVKP